MHIRSPLPLKDAACQPTWTNAIADGRRCSSRLAGVIWKTASDPSDLPQFRQINILLYKLKMSVSGTIQVFNFNKYVKPYLGEICLLLNRHFKMAAMMERIANAVCVCKPCPEQA
jgi:hypothetical protein